MKYLHLTNKALLVVFLAVIFASCEKVDKVNEIGDGGQTLVKIIDGGPDTIPATKLKSIDFISTPQSFLAIDIRRDCANQGDLNQTMHIVLRDDTNALNILNAELIDAGLNPYTYLDDTEYELDPGLTKTGGKGGTYAITLEPGEFAFPINIVVPDATVLDATAKYAIPFTIESADANGRVSESRTMVIILGAKNKYDGVYDVTGTFVDLANSSFSGAYPLEYHLITAGLNTVIVAQEYDPGVYYPFYLFSTGTAYSLYGSFGLVVTFDPATDEITDVHNYYGDPSNPANGVGDPSAGSGAPNYSAAPPRLRRAVLDNNGTYAYDEATKVVNIKYTLNQYDLGLPNNIRSIMDEVWTYSGPRP